MSRLTGHRRQNHAGLTGNNHHGGLTDNSNHGGLTGIHRQRRSGLGDRFSGAMLRLKDKITGRKVSNSESFFMI
jgi:hypothetical protein